MMQLRLAQDSDIPALEVLIPLSVHALQAPYYSQAQRDAALGPIFGVDRQLIHDGTYFVAGEENQIVACGGWSKRKSLFGGDQARATEDSQLDPATDAARIRAFFVHPDFARRGLGRDILLACEEAILAASFHHAELVATLAGEPLYAKFGYAAVERYDLTLANGLPLPVVRMTKRWS